MPALNTDRLHRGWDMPYLDQIKMCIRSMPYGDLMNMANKAATDGDITGTAKQLWDWANGNENTQEQSTEERTRLPRGGESDIIE